ncbi:HAD family hydrolase, partial [Streptomyces sp. DT225]
RTVRAVTLDREAADTALGKIEAQVGQVFAAVDQDGAEGRTLIEPGYRLPHATLPAQRTRHRDELWAEPVIKVLIRHPELTAEELGVDPGTAIAFGDMPNDLPMFRSCGYGVAMGNAHPELRAAADEVTLSNEEDGIAVVLERLFGHHAGRGSS